MVAVTHIHAFSCTWLLITCMSDPFEQASPQCRCLCSDVFGLRWLCHRVVLRIPRWLPHVSRVTSWSPFHHLPISLQRSLIWWKGDFVDHTWSSNPPRIEEIILVDAARCVRGCLLIHRLVKYTLGLRQSFKYSDCAGRLIHIAWIQERCYSQIWGCDHHTLTSLNPFPGLQLPLPNPFIEQVCSLNDGNKKTNAGAAGQVVVTSWMAGKHHLSVHSSIYLLLCDIKCFSRYEHRSTAVLLIKNKKKSHLMCFENRFRGVNLLKKEHAQPHLV